MRGGRLRQGLLQWTEEDLFDAGRGTIHFRLLDGDFEHFAGSWSVRADDDGTVVEFRADLDVGLSSLGSVIEPIAERSLRENILSIVGSLVGPGAESSTDRNT